ncbi:hypothetical protein N0Y54_31635 [Nostoc punctiforme UO1]|uniref:hypothetical protein n=1 Tax=Nostoc punctiforme TaxID=272131 RepID=UPI0030AA2E35
MKVLKSLEAPNIWKQAFIPLTIFVHEFDCWCGWTRLYHTLYLGSSVCTLLYYRQSDKTGLIWNRLRSLCGCCSNHPFRIVAPYLWHGGNLLYPASLGNIRTIAYGGA